MNERVGIIGVGLVGAALAQRLLAAGYRVVGFDVRPEAREALTQAGGQAMATASEVAAGCERVILSLPTSQIARAVIDEILPHLDVGALVIDTTTGAPEDSEGFAALLARAEVEYMDATVGGSSRQVREGDAILICGGSETAFARCVDLFEHCARQAFHVGPAGSGARMKLVTNLVLGLNRAVLAEGLEFARACGVDPFLALEVLKSGPAYSRAMDIKGARMLKRDFAPEARLSQHLKDVRLIRACGAKAGAWLPLSEVHQQLLEAAECAGYGGADNSAVIEAYRGAFPQMPRGGQEADETRS